MHLDQFHGSETLTRHALVPKLCFTEGIDYLRQRAEAFWLIDDIASYYIGGEAISRQSKDFQYIHFWKLSKKGEGAVLTCVEDTGKKPVITQEYDITTFPFEATGDVTLFCQMSGTLDYWVLMLPGEY